MQKPSARKPASLALAPGDQFSHGRYQREAIVESILDRIQAPDEKGGDAEVMMVEQGFGDLRRVPIGEVEFPWAPVR
jgi:hypothetical protein